MLLFRLVVVRTIMCNVTEFVEVNDDFKNVGKFQSNEFWAFHWCVEIKIFDVNCHDVTFLVEMTLLRRILTVIMSAVGVPQSPGKLIRLPPAVR